MTGGVFDTVELSEVVSKLNLQQINIILAFDYSLNSPIAMQMEGLALISIDTISSS